MRSVGANTNRGISNKEGKEKKVKNVLIATAATLSLGLLIVGCGEPRQTDSADSIQPQGQVYTQPFVMTDAQKQAINEAMAARDRILMGLAEPQPAFVMTDAQKQAINEAMAARDRILMGY